MGIPGLLLISFLDSAAVPMAGGPDAVILLLAWQRPAMAIFIVLAATLGSLFGCLVLYGIGKKGGEKVLSRFRPEKTAWVKRKMDEYGSWAVLASVIAPPPFPTKPVILAAGVLQTDKWKFSAAVFSGRLLRYSMLGYLAARYGDSAAQILKAHYPEIFLALIGIILLILLARYIKNKKQATDSHGIHR
jgi:membrane protein YqaA with SNARE-associated domain